MNGTLFIVATPIGNLADITFRAVDTLKSVSVIAAEDTRVTQKLLSRYDISTPLVSYREQNAARVVPQLIDTLQAGNDVAVVSDAGTPSISDPGSELVRAAVEAGIRVSPIPGPSAMSAAVSASALDGEGVRFLGFLPRKGKERKERISTIAQDPSCSVLYESPHRLTQTLADLAAECGPRSAVVFRELTKIHEEIRKGTLPELASYFSENVRGEITLIVEGNRATGPGEITDEKLTEMVQKELDVGKSAKDIAASLSTALGIRKKKIYDLTVSLIQK
ncbi:MAG: 16S rRNA (cytidine(1402)-2'-O)-methyltransferase [Deltaproteobacteria bacterium]|nr:16S rRNA (cytidine(1402)-2'-O)-methyltransferase [Deltaproteobacteria bacterium]MBN2672909.1 16S rRNA (cytidine(1402)-2'-O)-methyltransferase [Deltaproteobacteria bacterium]